MLPLTTANLLSHAIIGSVLENLDMERLIHEVGQAVAERILGGNESVDDVARELHEKLLLRNESTQSLVVENIYRDSDEARHNVKVWSEAPNIQAARPFLQKIPGSRFTDKYLAARYQPSSRNPYPPVPIRTPIKPTSPSRKVVSDFATFKATPVAHPMFGSAGAAAPTFGSPTKGRTSFGGMRGSSMDDDDEEGDGSQRIGLSEGAITLDQARRITLQSAWRSARNT